MKSDLAATVLCSLAALSSLVSASPVPSPEAGVEHSTNTHVERGLSFETIKLDDTQGTTHGTWERYSDYGHDTYDNTESVTHQSGASLHFANNYHSVDSQIKVTVFATKRDTRGKFSVYCGNTLIGVGNEYTSSSSETNTEVVFSSGSVTCLRGNDIIIKNDKGAAHVAVDEVDIAILVDDG